MKRVGGANLALLHMLNIILHLSRLNRPSTQISGGVKCRWKLTLGVSQLPLEIMPRSRPRRLYQAINRLDGLLPFCRARKTMGKPLE